MTALLLLALWTSCLTGGGVASWYSETGHLTASGAVYSETQMTAAHRTMPLGTVLEVTAGGKPVTVRITDRGPYAPGRVLDLSPAAFAALTGGRLDRGLMTVMWREQGRDTTGLRYNLEAT